MGLKFEAEGKGTLGEILPGWSANEFATPHVVGETADGINNASYSGVRTDDSIFLVDKTGTITHVSDIHGMASLGSVSGTIQSAPDNYTNVAVSQDSILTRLNVDRVVPPMAGGQQYGTTWTQRAKDNVIGGYGVVAHTTSYDNKYIYVLTAISTNGPGRRLTKFEINTGALQWSRILSTTPDAAYSGALAATAGDYVLLQITPTRGMRLFGSTGLAAPYGGGDNLFTIQPADSINTLSDAYPNYPTTWATSSQDDSIYLGYGSNFYSSADPYPSTTRTTAIVAISENGGSYDATSRGAAFTAAQTPTNAQPNYPEVMFYLGSDMFVSRGPLYPADTASTGWTLSRIRLPRKSSYSSIDEQFLRVRNLNVDLPAWVGVTPLDASGFFVIGDRQFDIRGNQVFSWEDERKKLTDRYPDGKWSVSGQSPEGIATYIIYPEGNSGAKTLIIEVARINARITLSQVLGIYIGMVLGGNYVYEIDYQATKDPTLVLPGWNGNVIDHIYQLCVVYKIEMVFVDGKITFRDVGSRSIDVTDMTISRVTPTVVGNSRNVAVNYLNTRTVAQAGSPAIVLQNLSRNPTTAVNTSGYAAMPGGATVLQTYESQSPFYTGFRSSWPNNSYPTTNDVYVMYGSGLFNGTRLGPLIRAGLTPGETYIVTVEVYVYNAKNVTNVHPDALRVMARMNKANGDVRLIKGKKGDKNLTVWRKQVLSVEFYFDPDYTDLAIIFHQGMPLDSGASIRWSNVRISPKGLETDEFPDDEPYTPENNTKWKWTGTRHNSISSYSAPAVEADNLLYSARTDENRTISIASRAREVITLTLDSYPTSLTQPKPTSNLNAGYGTYYVSGSDNLPVQAAQWEAYGGRVEVTVNAENGNQIDVLVVGPYQEIPGVPGPYKFAASDDATDYAFFSITGTGVRTRPVTLTRPTGVTPSKITREDSGAVDNFAVATIEQAQDMAYGLSHFMGAATVEMSFSLPLSRVEKFGVTPGSIYTHSGAVWRVMAVVINNASATITARKRTTVGDVFSYYEGKNAYEVSAIWYGYTAHDTTVRPMRGLEGGA